MEKIFHATKNHGQLRTHIQVYPHTWGIKSIRLVITKFPSNQLALTHTFLEHTLTKIYEHKCMFTLRTQKRYASQLVRWYLCVRKRYSGTISHRRWSVGGLEELTDTQPRAMNFNKSRVRITIKTTKVNNFRSECYCTVGFGYSKNENFCLVNQNERILCQNS